MNLDELQSVQARERQSSDLQHLRASFYAEVGEFIGDLRQERAELVEEAEDPFSSAEVRQLSADVETAEQTVEAIYERRVGKVVKKASITAAGMPVDADGLTAEEEALFEDLVDRIEQNREDVLSVLGGDASATGHSIDGPTSRMDADEGSTSDGDDATASTDGVSAAELMGTDDGDESSDGDASDDDESNAGAEPPSDESDGPTEVPPDSAPPGGSPDADGPDDSKQTDTSDEDDAESFTEEDDDSVTSTGAGDGASSDTGTGDGNGDDDVPGIPRTTVRITADVGEVVGADDRDYVLEPEDVVTLPAPNADVLVEKDAAERLE